MNEMNDCNDVEICVGDFIVYGRDGGSLRFARVMRIYLSAGRRPYDKLSVATNSYTSEIVAGKYVRSPILRRTTLSSPERILVVGEYYVPEETLRLLRTAT